MLGSKKISALLARSWKKSFFNRVVTLAKMRQYNNCNGEILCMTCNNQVIENKELEANINLLRRDVPNESSHMLPYYKE